jgi:hypothetical protein
MAIVATINSRRIMEREPIGVYRDRWYCVELRGPTTNKSEMLVVWRTRHTLAEAIAEAERLGPMTEQPDDLNDDPDFSKLKCERPLLDPREALRIKEETEAAAQRGSAPSLGGGD